jgi:AcrR family transcriptional regulator
LNIDVYHQPVPATARPILPPEVVDEYRRRQVAEAIAELASEQGLQALTVKSICARCAMGRAKFYELYGGTAGATEDALDRAFETTFGPVRQAIAEGPEESQRSLEVALDALLAATVEEPRLAELCLVHSISAPGNHCRHWEAAVDVLRSGLTSSSRDEAEKMTPEDLRPAIEELLCRSILTAVAQRLREGRGEQLQEDRAILLRLGKVVNKSAENPPLADSGALQLGA